MSKTVIAGIVVIVIVVVAAIGIYYYYAQPKPPTVITIGSVRVPTHLDPVKTTGADEFNTEFNIYDYLVEWEPETLEIVPGLATSWDESEDYTVWTFNLRQDVKFHDGTPFNASAAKFNIDRYLANGSFRSGLGYIANVTVVDDYTIKIFLSQPNPLLLRHLSIFIGMVSPTAIKVHGEDYIDTHPVGTGPYKVTEYVEDDRIVLEANENYWGTPPKNNKIVLKKYADSASLKAAFEAGEIDIIWSARGDLFPTDVEDLKSKGYNVIESESNMIRYMVFNEALYPFNDTRVRKAIAYAVNRTKIVDVVFKNQASELYTQVAEGIWGHVDTFPERNLTAAVSLLNEAGYNSTNKLEITLYYSSSYYGTAEEYVAQVIKEDLEETDVIAVTLQNVEKATFREQYKAGQYGMWLLGWFPPIPDPNSYLYYFMNSVMANAIFSSHYNNTEADSLLSQALSTFNQTLRQELYEELQTIM
ncbi:hypothetical protein DRO69_12750, partial [Candidatus Bathyarchaeota archaeon]